MRRGESKPAWVAWVAACACASPASAEDALAVAARRLGVENISSLEVEAALFDHPDVTEAAVFAVPHDALGEEVGAVVRLTDGATVTTEDLRAHVAAQLAPFKVPAHLWLTEEPFPRGPTGKIQKREMKAAYTRPTRTSNKSP